MLKRQEYQFFNLIDAVLLDLADIFDQLGQDEIVFVIDGEYAHQR